MNTHTTPKIRPEETLDQTLTRLSIWAGSATELLHSAVDLPNVDGMRSPDRLRVIAETLADVASELDAIADFISGHRRDEPPTPPEKHSIKSRDELSFTIRGEHGGLINWNVKHDLEDYWSEHVEIGKRYFSEIVELAEYSERDGLFGMLYAICSPTFLAGWGEEHGFVEMMARAAIIGMRAIRNGADTHINLKEPGHDDE
jgi:hypothetical protein